MQLNYKDGQSAMLANKAGLALQGKGLQWGIYFTFGPIKNWKIKSHKGWTYIGPLWIWSVK